MRGKVVVDVGAHIGAFSLLAAAQGARRVLAFEPGEENYRLLAINAASCVAIEPYHAAVWRSDHDVACVAWRPSSNACNTGAGSVIEGRTIAGVPFAERERHDVAAVALDAILERAGPVGLLKIDAEGADPDVLRGAGGIGAEIVMVEFWGDLPDTLGRCQAGLDELRSLVEPLGPRRFLFVRHGPRHVSIGRWDTADPGEGEWGNLIFVADSLVGAAEAALPELDRGLRARGERLIAAQETAAAERLALIEQLSEQADARLELIERLTQEAEKRRGPLERLRRRRGGPSDRSAGAPGFEALDDVDQEGSGGRAV
jgi:FkbM family methyltransferase